MINKIIAFLFLPMLVIALFLSFAGVEYIDPSSSVFLDLLRSVSYRYNQFNFSIPNIPTIPDMSNASGLIEALVSIGNGFVTVVNVLILIINVVITVIQFIIALIWTMADFVRGVPVIPRPTLLI